MTNQCFTRDVLAVEDIFNMIKEKISAPKEVFVNFIRELSINSKCDVPPYESITFTDCKGRVDHHAVELIKGTHTDTFVPMEVTGDGACFFNSLSVLLYGSEKQSKKLRLSTLYYLANNWGFLENCYNRFGFKCAKPLYKTFF